MILSNTRKVELQKTVNMFGVGLLKVIVHYNDMRFISAGIVQIKHKTRLFAKSEGSPWVESHGGGKYTRIGDGVALELSEYCSHRGYLIPME